MTEPFVFIFLNGLVLSGQHLVPYILYSKPRLCRWDNRNFDCVKNVAGMSSTQLKAVGAAQLPGVTFVSALERGERFALKVDEM